MKNIKKVILFFISVFYLTTFSFSNEDEGFRIQGPYGKSICIVGKIEVIYNCDRDFYIETFNIDEKRKNMPDLYSRPDPFFENQCIDRKKIPEFYENGTCFYDYCWVMKGKIRYKSLFSFYLFRNKKKKIVDADDVFIELPAVFDFYIPSDSKYVCIGKIRYYLTEDFKVKKVEIIDDYDEIKKEFDSMNIKNAELARAFPVEQ